MTNPSAGQGLPTGTVTFLFTDIEGSTKLALWAVGRSMEQAIQLVLR